MSPSRRRRRASPEWAGRDVITVAALPGRGVYVRHLAHPEGVDGVHRPTVAAVGAAQPARPPSFERHWLEAHASDFDVIHVHGLPARGGAADTRQAGRSGRRVGRWSSPPTTSPTRVLAAPITTRPGTPPSWTS